MNDPVEALPQVLIVDDEPDIRAIVSDLLVHEGFRVLTAANGVEALRVLESNHVELVISDMKMPEMGGLELLGHIRERFAHIVAVMITAFSTVETAIESMKRGAFDYVMKPFNVDQLLHAVHRARTQQKLKAENIELKAALSLYRLAARLGDEVELGPTLTAIVDTVHEQVAADRVSLMLFDGDAHADRGAEPAIAKADLTPAGLAISGAQIINGGRIFEYLAESPHTETVDSMLVTPLSRGGERFGVLLAVREDGRRGFTEGERKLLTIIADRAAVAVQNAALFNTLERSFTATIEAFVHALEEKDRYTAGHSERVAEYSRVIAIELGMTQAQVKAVYQGARLHDIGKIIIRSEELNKPGPLTEEEYERFKQHPAFGERLMAPIPTFHGIIPAIGGHHERFDGKGYPRGTTGFDIPLMARIVAVADTYDAMTSHRAYRAALPHSFAVKELRDNAGTQFDPECVQAFLRGIEPWRTARQAAGLPFPD